MIDKQKLYDATNDGLMILEIHYGQSVVEAARTGQKFKRRPDERTPSASVRKYQRSKSAGMVWKVTDFGDEGVAKDPIQIHMEETGMKFADAVKDLAARFGIKDEQGFSTCKPDIRKKPAEAEQEDGKTYWDIDQNFSEAECKVMGPKVTPEHLKALNWYRVNWICSVKNREAVYKYPNSRYPIFMRECWHLLDGKPTAFYKIYEPMNQDKGFRFQYQPKGAKPQRYTNGLHELRQAYKAYNEKAEKEFYQDPDNENKTFKGEKFEEAVICSGERDALCVKSLGYFPVWFNSETYQVSQEEMKEIYKYVKRIYNIPDIDSTGRQKGTELALRYIDVHTVWLPESLRLSTDWRGNPCKDFRDWCERHGAGKEAFRKRLTLATPAKFWTTYYSEKSEKYKYSVDISCLYEFLRLNGFHTLKDENAKEVQFIRITGNIVRIVTARDIRAFVVNWCEETGQQRELRNLVLSTPTLNQTSLEALKETDPDFTNFTPHSQFFYFPKFSIEVKAGEYVKREYRNHIPDRYVWEENVIDHDIKILPDMFEITHPDGDFSSEGFDIDVKDRSSNYFKYLINSSRIFWRKELEENTSWMEPADREAYLKRNAFRIDGELLTAEEIQEQKQCLINKIFTIGFLMHRFKEESRAWAPFVMDNIIGDSEQCNGRSGKSFMFRALSHFTKWLKLSGRNPKFFDNPFCFEMINKHQTFVVIDDCDKYLPFRQFYDNITSDITINAKNVRSYNLNYMETPKFVFTTNYVPRDFDPSSVDRMLFVVFSDYYHGLTDESDYRERRSIRDDIGKDLFSAAYTEAEWEADINFVMQCVKFYLSVSRDPVKILPKLNNIIFRRHIQEMGDNFLEWAEGYFAEDGENLNKELVRQDVFEEYKRYSGQGKITMQKFTNKLKSFCYTQDYIDCLNPEEMCNSSGRLQKRVPDKLTNTMVVRDMIFVRTKKAKEMGTGTNESGLRTDSETNNEDRNGLAGLFPEGEVYNP